MDKKYSTTTVKIPEKMYQDYKIMNVRTNINFQDLVHRSMYLYLTDSEFRFKIHQTYSTYYTGSDVMNAINSIK
jgi:hypothetical protein